MVLEKKDEVVPEWCWRKVKVQFQKRCVAWDGTSSGSSRLQADGSVSAARVGQAEAAARLT